MRSKSLLLVSLVFVAVAANAQAQEKKSVRSAPTGTVYKQTLPDGSVVYTDNPNRAVKIEKTLTPERRSIHTSQGKPLLAPLMDRSARNGVTPGVPGTVIPGMPPLPGDTALRPAPLAPQAAVMSQTQVNPRAVADAELRSAEDARLVAIKQVNDGAAAQAGERNGTAAGGSRLNEDYQKRQALLDANVKKAEEKVDEALQRRKAL